MAKHTPPAFTTAAGYLESEVSAWIHCRVRGEEWAPGPVPEHPRLIRLREAQRRTGLSNFALWTMEKAGKFPPRLKLTSPAAPPADVAA
jgi:predicted DNA-binding transcriptional regulator AlpA